MGCPQKSRRRSYPIILRSEFKQLEKANLTAALRHADWKVWGPNGAAELLGMKPSTLTYQMKQLGIEVTRGKMKRNQT